MKTPTTLFTAAGMAVLLTATAVAQTDMSDAEVRKVDLGQGKVTLKHGPIQNLDMPGMTMVFSVKDKAMLARIKAGDTVRFRAVNENGKISVSEIERVEP